MCVNVGVQGPQHVYHTHQEKSESSSRGSSHAPPRGGQHLLGVLPWHCDGCGGMTLQMASQMASMGLSMVLIRSLEDSFAWN